MLLSQAGGIGRISFYVVSDRNIVCLNLVAYCLYSGFHEHIMIQTLPESAGWKLHPWISSLERDEPVWHVI
jgi:hypothetical protein